MDSGGLRGKGDVTIKLREGRGKREEGTMGPLAAYTAPVASFFDRIYMINRILGDKCGEADAHEPIVVPATLAFKPLAVRVC